MGDLATFGRHARRMATSSPSDRFTFDVGIGLRSRDAVGVLPDTERELWARLADEVDRYLAAADRDPGPGDVVLPGLA